MRKDLTALVTRKTEEFKGFGEQKSDDLIGLLIEANMADDGKAVKGNGVIVAESVVDDLMTVRLGKIIYSWTPIAVGKPMHSE